VQQACAAAVRARTRRIPDPAAEKTCRDGGGGFLLK
jgi:hypothetical protein